MSALVGVAPRIGAGSLDGLAIGALASGACFLAITASRRGRKRLVIALSNGVSPGRGPGDGRLCEYVMAAEAFPAYAERLAQPDLTDRQGWQQEGGGAAGHDGGPDAAGQEGTPGAGAREGQGVSRTFRAGRDGRAAGSHRSRRRRRLGDPVPGSASPGGAFGGADALREAACPNDLLPAGTSRHPAFPDSALHGGGSPDSASPDGAQQLPVLAFPDDTFGTSRGPEVRRSPRHAAPGTSLGRRLSARMGSVMAGLSATRALIGGAHG
jgi:hypothetical protein